jgi:hypothetical protein
MQVRGIADFVERLTGDSGELWWKNGIESCFKTFEDHAVHKWQKFKVVCEVQELRGYGKSKITEAS